MFKLPPVVYKLKALRQVRSWLCECLGVTRYSKQGLHQLDDKLAPYLNFKNGFFIEIGGNDGYTQSNTYYLEKCLGWTGILVEGIPDLYTKCRALRTRSRVYNYALTHDESCSSVTMHFSGLMSVVDGSLKDPDTQTLHIQKGYNFEHISQGYSVEVPARTLGSLLDEIPDLPPIDFLSLDVEGAELQVLQGMNLSKYAPMYLLIEARFFSEINDFLGDTYALIAPLTKHDYLYRRKRPPLT